MSDLAVIGFKLIDIAFARSQNSVKYDNVTVEEDIVYSDVADCCKLNFHYDPSKKDGKWPVMVQVHGGGFVAGDKKYRKTLCGFFANEGFFVLNVNYGLAPEYTYDQYVKHLGLAMNWLADNGDKYDLDLNNVSVTGDSAGGHATSAIGALYANDEFRNKFGVEDFSTKLTITHLLPACGLYDVKKALAKKFPFNAGKMLCQDITGMKLKKDMSDLPDYEYYNEFSTINFVNEKFPPTHVVQVKGDMFCDGQGDAFYQKLKDNGVPCELFTASRKGDIHCFHLSWKRESSKEWCEAMKDYIAREIIKK